MTEAIYQKRRQRVFFVLSGMFLGTLAMLNILGVTRFLDFSFTVFGLQIPMIVAVGVLPYPVTFMCTDLISELFGEEKARDMVLVGLLLNVWVVFLLWLGSVLPGAGVDPATGAPLIDAAGRKPVFFEVKDAAFGAVAASMVAYLVAQFCDVRIFHWMKRLTKGRHLWLRNNVSTMFSQLVDYSCDLGDLHRSGVFFTFERQRAGVATTVGAYCIRLRIQVGGSCAGHWPYLSRSALSKGLPWSRRK